MFSSDVYLGLKKIPSSAHRGRKASKVVAGQRCLRDWRDIRWQPMAVEWRDFLVGEMRKTGRVFVCYVHYNGMVHFFLHNQPFDFSQVINVQGICKNL